VRGEDELPIEGREKEIYLLATALEECLGTEEAKVIRVLAPEGVGKTRLAREMAARFAKRVPVSDAFDPGAEAPRAFVLDDVHLEGGETFASIRAFASESPPRPLLVLAFGRPEGAFAEPMPGATTFELPLLVERASERVVRNVFPDVYPSQVDRVVLRCGGNAARLVEMATRLRAAGKYVLRD